MKFAVAIGIIGFLPTIDFGFGKKHWRIPQLDKPAAPVAQLEECTNFSGTWKGTCTHKSDNDPAEVTNEAMTITQDGCDSIDMDDETFKFGGTHTEADTDSEFTVSMTRMVDWNKGKASFVLDLNLTGRLLSRNVPVKVTGTGGGTVQFVDGRLVSSFKMNTYNFVIGTQKIFTSSTDCTYERQ